MNNNIILSIIIPSYKETEKEIFPLLSSINNQVGIDLDTIEIIISRDGTNEINLDIFNYLNLNIKQIISKENKGPGIARQLGLDQAQGKYIMFCDADDLIQNAGIIGAMINEIEKNDLDILTTAWLEECWVEKLQRFTYLKHENENTWMHGKMFKHNFLLENNIKFHPDLRVHEDTYFLGICSEYTSKIGFLNSVSYIWKWSADSITRKDNGIYRFNEDGTFLKSCIYILDKIASRGEKFQKNLAFRTVQLTIYQYFVLHSKVWKEHPEIISKIEKLLTELITPYWDYWLNSDIDFIATIYNNERQKHFSKEIEFETLEQWITHLNLPFRRE